MIWFALLCGVAGLACGAGVWWHMIGFLLIPSRSATAPASENTDRESK